MESIRDLHTRLWKMGFSVHYRDVDFLDGNSIGQTLATVKDGKIVPEAGGEIIIATGLGKPIDLILRHEFCHASGHPVVAQTPEEAAVDLRCGSLPQARIRFTIY